MIVCPHCRHDFASSLDECPHCGMERQPHADASVSVAKGPSRQPHVPIARFVNVAEAGYFHCELEGRMPCEVRLVTQNHFDAPSASWSTNYVLSVPETDAVRATEILKQIVADTDPSGFIEFGDEPGSPPDFSTDELPVDDESVDGFPVRDLPADGVPAHASRIHWAPIILTLTAGTFVVWAAKQVQRQVRNRGGEPNQVDIWEQLGGEGRPWIQKLDDGRGQRELQIDPTRKFATLREDADGDGVYERRSRISLTPADQ